MVIKVLIINGLIISAILGVVYFGQQKNSETVASNFYKKAVESNKLVKSADNWLNETFFEKARQEAEKRQEIATESIGETVEDAKKGLLDMLWQGTVGKAQQGIAGAQQVVGNALGGGTGYVSEKVSETFCPAQK
ncbi:MAG: hypothetical protein Q7S10_03665 [bacterium]|nr:hypothetical protein [bacterium]